MVGKGPGILGTWPSKWERDEAMWEDQYPLPVALYLIREDI